VLNNYGVPAKDQQELVAIVESTKKDIVVRKLVYRLNQTLKRDAAKSAASLFTSKSAFRRLNADVRLQHKPAVRSTCLECSLLAEKQTWA
jgi:RNase P subunit RPR2